MRFPGMLGLTLAALAAAPSAARAQTRADSLAIVSAVLVEMWAVEPDASFFVRHDAGILLREAHESLGGREVAADERVLCPGQSAHTEDSVGWALSLSLRGSPPSTDPAVAERAAAVPGFTATAADARVPVGMGCWRNEAGADAAVTGGRTLTAFSTGYAITLKKIDGVWTVTDRRPTSAS